jgi:hypothetical protein
MRFKEYLEYTESKTPIKEEVVYGGLMKIFKRLEFWFDTPKSVPERIARLEQELVNAGGPNKFAMVVRRIPSIKHFLMKHKDELVGDLAKTASLIKRRHGI